MTALQHLLMYVELTVLRGTDISVIEREYPDINLDYTEENEAHYFIGKSEDETLENDDGTEMQWLTRDEAVEFCGFCEGAVPDAEVLIEGNGGWAQGMISRRDFSGLCIKAKEKHHYKRTSNRYWKAHQRGSRLAKRLSLSRNRKSKIKNQKSP